MDLSFLWSFQKEQGLGRNTEEECVRGEDWVMTLIKANFSEKLSSSEESPFRMGWYVNIHNI